MGHRVKPECPPVPVAFAGSADGGRALRLTDPISWPAQHRHPCTPMPPCQPSLARCGGLLGIKWIHSQAPAIPAGHHQLQLGKHKDGRDPMHTVNLLTTPIHNIHNNTPNTKLETSNINNNQSSSLWLLAPPSPSKITSSKHTIVARTTFPCHWLHTL